MNINEVYQLFLNYYGNIPMYLINQQTDQSGQTWYIYATCVKTFLNEYRYIYAVVPSYSFVGEQGYLENLQWVSFQTRVREDLIKIPQIDLLLTPDRKEKMQHVLVSINRDKDTTYYTTSTLPVNIRLLHDPKKNNTLQYPDKLYLYQALETYRCVLDLL